ncbi:WXG100 family type VII secretion target [Bacillus sp. FJAT-47783]|uniref:WXG100 family type VII secretion target n=1 Tax=Bacillus sp. FJAT-47783 TaxID=2922712 RepID=UPI001FAE101F|nr:WXG100 family type VII secretion target [Bacillus sp. FJAT-47783]
MNSKHVRELAQDFYKASESIKEREENLKKNVRDEADTWSGKSRDKFNAIMEEASVAFQRHSDNLYEISKELEKAANEVDRVREEIERQRELEKLTK